ncbi:MAG: protein kinase [Planctomycetes bacterium]|nr:protein kinase [Planctomycetota bacterium]
MSGSDPEGGGVLPGTIGPYEVLEELGRGAMGVVYRARHRELGREVALKVLPTDAATDPQGAERFAREARLAARLSHPRVVSVHEVGSDGDRRYMALELVRGRPLSQVIDTERIGLDRALTLTRRVAEGLAYAHSQGVIHRDVKPHNILVDEDGFPRITDFGLARELGSESRLTLAGTVVGTPAYMAPEQARGDAAAVGPLSDVYGLGAVLYEMLALKPPFQGANPADILARVLTVEPVPLRRVNPQVPRDVATMVGRAMEKDPARRYAGAREFAEDLDRYLRGESIQARPPSWTYLLGRWTRRNRALALALSLSAVAFLALGTRAAWREHRRRSAEDHFAQARHSLLHGRGRKDLQDARDQLNQALAIEPELARAWYERGRLSYEEGDFGPALEDCRTALERNPSLAVAAHGAALATLRLRPGLVLEPNRPMAREILAGLFAGEPGGPFATLADAYLELTAFAPDYAAVEERLREFPDSRPPIADVHLLRGLVQAQFKIRETHEVDFDDRAELRRYYQPARAMASLDRYVDLEPLNYMGYYVRATLRNRLRDLEGALEDFTRLAELYPGRGSAHAGRVRLLMSLDRHAEARAALDAARPLAKTDVGLLDYLDVLLRLIEGDLRRGEEVLARLQGHNLSWARALIRMCYAARREDFRAFSEAVPEVMDGMDQPEVRATAQRIARYMDLDPTTRDAVMESLDAAPAVFMAEPAAKAGLRILMALGRALAGAEDEVSRQSGREDLADLRDSIQAIQRIGREPRMLEYMRRLGPVRLKDGGELDPRLILSGSSFILALTEGRALRSLEADLRTARDLLTLANGWWLDGQAARATEALRRAARLDPWSVEARYGLATQLALEGEVEEALAELRCALLAGWDRPRQTWEDPDFQALRPDPRFKRLLRLAAR